MVAYEVAMWGQFTHIIKADLVGQGATLNMADARNYFFLIIFIIT